MLGVPDDDVGDLAWLDAAEHLAQAQRARGVAGHAEQRLLGREAELRAGERHVELQRRQRRAAGIEIARDRDRHAVHTQELDRRPPGLAQVGVRAGQQHGDGARRRHRLHTGLVEVLEVVGGERLVLRGERGALLVGELLGVQLYAESEFLRLDEHAFDLYRREADGVAVGVDGVGQSFGNRGRQDLVAHILNVIVRPVLELRRHGMGGEQGRADVDREPRAERARDAKDLELVVLVEPVAGLDLHRGHALGDVLAGARERRRQQVRLARGARRGDGVDDAAAGPGDVLVARALQALLEFLVAAARPHQVGVAVDEPGRHQCVVDVGDGAVLRQRLRQIALGSDPGDSSACKCDRAFRNEAVGTALGAGCEGRIADDPGPGRSVEDCHGPRAYRKPPPPRYAAYVPDVSITREFVAALPKTDLHVHLDGSLRIPTLIDLAREYRVELPSYTEAGLRETVYKERYTSLGDYLKGFRYTVGVMQSAEALERIAAELAEDNQVEGVRYLEVRFAPQLHVRPGLDAVQVLAAVDRGLRRARDAYNRRPEIAAGREPAFEYGIICSALRMFGAGFSHHYDTLLAAHPFR